MKKEEKREELYKALNALESVACFCADDCAFNDVMGKIEELKALLHCREICFDCGAYAVLLRENADGTATTWFEDFDGSEWIPSEESTFDSFDTGCEHYYKRGFSS